MSNIKKAFDHGKAFIGFVTAGDPSLEKTEEFVLAMEEAGCDLIELGIPFSDPIAEGPVIQEANIRALKAGANLERIFQTVESLRKKTDIPLVFLTYLNPVFRYGYEKFFARCAEAGVDGVIIPDLPFEEKGEVTPFSRKNAVNLISLVAPTSEDRIRTIAADADGFLYLVSSMGVTGIRKEITTDLSAMMELVREASDIPAAVGFGVSTPEQAAQVAAPSDGAIVGSAIVRIVAKYGSSAAPHIADYVRQMKAAVQSAEKK